MHCLCIRLAGLDWPDETYRGFIGALILGLRIMLAAAAVAAVADVLWFVMLGHVPE